MRLIPTLAATCFCLLTACTADDPAAGTSSGGRGRDAGARDAEDDDFDGDGDDDDDDAEIPRLGDACASLRQDAPVQRAAVDVVWVIDTSASMFDDIAQITANLGSFMQQLEGSNADTRAIMITGLDPALGSPLSADRERYRFVPSPVESNMLYTVALFQFDAYRDFLRPEATPHFVMVTDDEDTIAGALFRAEMEKKLGRSFVLHAIASPSVNGLPCAGKVCGGIWAPLVCGAVAIGHNYNTVASETGGEQISICTDDWTEILGRLSSAVIASALPCSYALDAASDDFDAARVQVVYTTDDDGDREFPKAARASACGSKAGWYYDDPAAPSTIELCPAACELVKQGGSIDIALGCPPATVI